MSIIKEPINCQFQVRNLRDAVLDSPGGDRFDNWFAIKLKKNSNMLKRQYVRFLAQIINAVLKDFDIADFEKDELERCYEGAWSIASYVINEKASDKDLTEQAKKHLKKIIKENIVALSQLISGEITSNEYSRTTCQCLKE